MITVLMPVYNSAATVREAIVSALPQLSARDEVLVVDDGSTDGTLAAIQTLRDPRIRLVRNEANSGVAATLNRGLALARGEYLLRLDSDDLCAPGRVRRQVAFMESHPSVAVCGSWIRLFGDVKPVTEFRPWGASCVKASLLFDNPLAHPSVILRKEAVDRLRLEFNGKEFSRSEDYDLWCRLATHADMDNLPCALTRVRLHGGSVTAQTRQEMERQSRALQERQLNAMGIYPAGAELEFHRRVGHGERLNTLRELDEALRWLLRLIEANRQARIHDEAGFEAAVGWTWARTCQNSAPLGWEMLRMYRQLRFRRPLAPAPWLRFWATACFHLAQSVSRS